MHMYATMCMWKSEGSLLELVQFFYCDLGIELKLSGVVAGAFSQMSHLFSPFKLVCFFEKHLFKLFCTCSNWVACLFFPMYVFLLASYLYLMLALFLCVHVYVNMSGSILLKVLLNVMPCKLWTLINVVTHLQHIHTGLPSYSKLLNLYKLALLPLTNINFNFFANTVSMSFLAFFPFLLKNDVSLWLKFLFLKVIDKAMFFICV